jgi:hypothetical protein
MSHARKHAEKPASRTRIADAAHLQAQPTQTTVGQTKEK